jgi:hypothetical protein
MNMSPLSNIPQDAPLPKPVLKDMGSEELEVAATNADAASFLARLMGKPVDVKRSGITADSDTIRVTRVHGRLVYRHLHPQDPPTIMVADPEVRNGYVCPSCGDELDSATAKALEADVKIEEYAVSYKEKEDKEFADTPVEAVGNAKSEFIHKVKVYKRTPDQIREYVGKMAGLGNKIVGYEVEEETFADMMRAQGMDPATAGSLVIIPGQPNTASDKTGVQIITLYFEDKRALYAFFQDEKVNKFHKRMNGQDVMEAEDKQDEGS